MALIVWSIPPALLTAFFHPLAPVSPLHGESLAQEVDWIESRRDSRFANALWIDARTAEAYAQGHREGAVRLTEAEWEDLLGAVIDAWQPGQLIVVYCDSSQCNASAAVAARLKRDLAWQGIYILKGGWNATH